MLRQTLLWGASKVGDELCGVLCSFVDAWLLI
jgi:hypothetical protein